MINKKNWSFLIVAAGSGSRLGGIPKQFRMLADIPVWKWSVTTARKLLEQNIIYDIVLVVSKEYFNEVKKELKHSKIPVEVVVGGKTRSKSVKKGLKACSGTKVLIHDAARPFLTEKLCFELIEAFETHEAVFPVLKSTDSLKAIENGEISSVNRDKIYNTQTPQAFNKKELLSLLLKSELENTDEAAVWINAGRKISTIHGEESNFKITTQFDWERAVLMKEHRVIQRTGHGYDVHQLVEGRKLILAGVYIQSSTRGLLGHSDADVVFHAVMDSLLGAAGEPDIGTLFPASDLKWKDADSGKLLEYVVVMLRLKKWKIDWVDVTLIAQTPRLAAWLDDFKNSLFSYLKEDDLEVNVNMKIKSAEECGSVGRSECMVCYAISSISKNSLFPIL